MGHGSLPQILLYASIYAVACLVWAAFQESGSWHSGMLYHGGAMAGANHESRGEERWDGLDQGVRLCRLTF
jgi:hypothetical protein